MLKKWYFFYFIFLLGALECAPSSAISSHDLGNDPLEGISQSKPAPADKKGDAGIKVAPNIAGDRGESPLIVFPEDAFARNGGRIIDVTKDLTEPPINAAKNAMGDGKADDTKTLRDAYTFVADQLRVFGKNQPPASTWTIYLPNGKYLVSDTIIHDGPRLPFQEGKDIGDAYWGGMVNLRIVGQNRDKTQIRLKRNSPQFNTGSPKRVLAFLKEGDDGRLGTNAVAHNLLDNLTISIGSGNPDAIGVLFLGANVCMMGYVRVVSEDGTGVAGIETTWSTQGYFHDIVVEGFDQGIWLRDAVENNPTFEYITLKNQYATGMLVEGPQPSIRRLLSINTRAAIKIQTDETRKKTIPGMVLMNSELKGGTADGSAIELTSEKAQVYLRDVKVGGYKNALKQGFTTVNESYIGQWLNGKVAKIFEKNPSKSLELDIKELPPHEDFSDLNQWQSVEKSTGQTDFDRIQNAMNSGKPVVYFTKPSYNVTKPIQVPRSVRTIRFLFSKTNFNLEITESSEDPLWFEYGNRVPGKVIVKKSRPLVFYMAGFKLENQQSEELVVHYLTGAQLSSDGKECTKGQTVFARGINPGESHNSDFTGYGADPNYILDGCTMWVLGYKTESGQISFLAKNGAKLEVLGGYKNAIRTKGLPLVVNEDSSVTFIGSVRHTWAGDQEAIWEVRNGTIYKLATDDLPPTDSHGFYIPLYVGLQ